MTIFTTVVIKSESLDTGLSDIVRVTGEGKQAVRRLINVLEGAISGVKPARISIKVDSVTVGDRASVTNTIVQASLVDNTDTLTIADVTLTWRTTPSGESQVAIGASDTAAAANLVAKINAHSQLKGRVTATAAVGVVTIRAATPGGDGELITLAEVGGGQTLSATRLAGVTWTSAAVYVDYPLGVA